MEIIQNEMILLKGGKLFIKQTFNCITCDMSLRSSSCKYTKDIEMFVNCFYRFLGSIGRLHTTTAGTEN